MKLRILVLLLVLANLVFFAWTLGWLDHLVGVRSIGDREPERLARQVNPESLRVVSPEAASAATFSPAASAASIVSAVTPASAAAVSDAPRR